MKKSNRKFYGEEYSDLECKKEGDSKLQTLLIRRSTVDFLPGPFRIL